MSTLTIKTKEELSTELNELFGTNIDFTKLSKDDLIILVEMFTGRNLLQTTRRLLGNRVGNRAGKVLDILDKIQQEGILGLNLRKR